MGVVEKVGTDRAKLGQYVELFRNSFGETSTFSVEYLDWLYARNPAGPAVGFDYVDAQKGVVSHYACIPAPLAIHGREVKAVLALNTATHTQFRGRGLFTELARMAFQGAADTGYEYAYGIPNASATSGLIDKQGFSLVCSLDAKICLGRYGNPTRLDGPTVAGEIAFRRIWRREDLEWRLNDPRARWRVRRGEGSTMRVWGPGPAPFVPTYDEIELEDGPDAQGALYRSFADPGAVACLPRLHLGKRPPGGVGSAISVDIPRLLRPAPLNFVVKNLQGETPPIDPDQVHFTALDFDAY